MRTHIKICGITTQEDARFAADAGADFLGYIFYPPSKRFIAPRSAAAIIRNIRAEFPHVRHVGVFVDEESGNVAWVRNLAGLDFVQLHGDETPAYCADLDAVGVDVIKVIGIGSAGARINAGAYTTPYYLFDTHDEKLKGGTGRQFDLASLPLKLQTDRVFLAGGFTPDNVAELLSHVQPFAVDVSSGVEDKPGVKCPVKVKKFIDNVRTATSHHPPQEHI